MPAKHLTHSQLADAYEEKFGVWMPDPIGVPVERVMDEAAKAIERGEPIDPEFNWWDYLPDDATS